ncbi:hypothetical protein [Micromonospora sp. NPDC005299]|uniref:phage tail protein n=1 Tax=Micromonospora sp. NPDC005299 TaxID=3364231 RepID=UPI003675B25A
MAGTEVGQAWVTIIPSAKGFAKNLQKSIAQELSGSGLDKAIADALGDRKPIKLPVKPDVDPKSVPDELPIPKAKKPKLPVKPEVDPKDVPDKIPVPKGKEPELPVELDPLIGEFQSQVRRQVAALSREVNANIPVGADTAGLRSELAAQIASVERQLKVEVPTEPAARREYEAKLHALVAEVSHKVKASVKVEPEVDRNRFRTALMSGVSSALGQVSSAASTMAGVVSNATSSLAGLATALVALWAGATFTVPAVYLVGGAIGSLPGIITGAVAALGALSLGMMGIADHFKEVSSGGGGAGENLAARARQVAQATRGVESAQRSLARAQREVVLAQQAVTRAREDEVERLQDLNRSVKRAHKDERDAIRAVKDAEVALADARATGRSDEIKDALSAYEDAVLDLEDARDAVDDLGKEQKKAAKVGVEGSDQVQDALRRQQDAVEGVTAANEQLLSAQEALQAANEKPPSGGGGAAQELMKLAPAAQKFVDTIKSLKPAFERLRLNVQQRLFEGLDKSVRKLATAWFPQLNRTLGDYASTFNRLAREAAASLRKKSFIDNMAAGAESARKALERIGRAVAGPLVDAFGRLSRAAGPFVERLGDELGKVIEDFSKWIEKLDKSGSLDTFFEQASTILSDVFDMGRDIFSIFGSIVQILFGEHDASKSPWEGLKLTLDKIAEWFKDPENQQKVRDFIDRIWKFLKEDLPEAIRKTKDAIDTVDGWFDTIEEWKNKVTGFRDRVKEAFGQVTGALRTVAAPVTFVLGEFSRLRSGASGQVSSVVATMRGVPGRIVSALGNTGRMLYQAGRNVVQGLIDGMWSKFGALHGVGAAVAQAVSDYLPHSPAKRGPLSGSGSPYLSGRSIVGMLSSGVTDTLGAARSAASDLAGTFALSGSSGAGLPASSPSVPAPGQLTAQWVGGDGDPIVRAIREHTRIYYGGSSQAAFGS